jgi:phosphoribosylformylglycinamidine (FGAM) synthase PurS component
VLQLDGITKDEARQHVERISREVLTNPVIEEFRFEILE